MQLAPSKWVIFCYKSVGLSAFSTLISLIKSGSGSILQKITDNELDHKEFNKLVFKYTKPNLNRHVVNQHREVTTI